MRGPMMRLADGTVLNSNLKIESARKYNKNENFAPVQAMLIEAYPKDHEKNKFKKGVEYKAVIVGGPREGEVIHNVQAKCEFGGKDNYHEVNYTPKKEVLKGKNKGDATPTENTDGSYVMIQFLNGSRNSGIITGALPQPNNEEYGSNDADGTLLRGKFNGLAYKIDKDGIFTLSREGTTITIDSAGGGINIQSDKTINIDTSDIVNINGTSEINLGSGANEAMVKGNALATLFNAHTHADSGEGVPNQTLGASQLSSLIKVK